MFRNQFLMAAGFGGALWFGLAGMAQAAPPAGAPARPPVIVNRPMPNPGLGRTPAIVNRPVPNPAINRTPVVNRPVPNPAINRTPTIVNRPVPKPVINRTPVIVNRTVNRQMPPGWDWWRTYPYSWYNTWRNPYWYTPYWYNTYTPYVMPWFDYYGTGSVIQYNGYYDGYSNGYTNGYYNGSYNNVPLPSVPAVPQVPAVPYGAN